MIAANVTEIWGAGTTEEDTHPSPVERVRLLGRLRTTEADGSGGDASGSSEPSLADIFAEPGQWQAMEVERKAAEAKTNAEGRQAYFNGLLPQVDAYITEHPGLATPCRDRGSIRMQMHHYAQAAADFSEAIRLGIPEPLALLFQPGNRPRKLASSIRPRPISARR